MHLPIKYEINVARANGVAWNGEPAYFWFCRVDAGGESEHAKRVAEAVKAAFPAPGYKVTLHQHYGYAKPVDRFDWRDF